jgi:hypothetical protein
MNTQPQAILTVLTTEANRPRPPFKGLCVNCDRRFTCTFPRSESGVWSCDEYL